MIKIKRIYEDPVETDGYRILIDRLWPRGVTKKRAKIDLWLKEVTPSDKLRKWYSHDPQKWSEFQNKYKTELIDKLDSLNQIKTIEKLLTLNMPQPMPNHFHITPNYLRMIKCEPLHNFLCFLIIL